MKRFGFIKITSLLLALIMMLSVASMVACNDTPKPTTPSTPTQPDNPDEPDDPDNPDDPDDPTEEAVEFPIAINRFSDVNIVVPANETNLIQYAKDKVKRGIKELTGATLFSSPTEKEYEILIGNTGRPESDQVIAELQEGEYAIKMIGKKIVIATAGDDAFLYEAASEFIKLLDGENVTKTDNEFTIKVELDVTKKGDTNSNYYKIVTKSELYATEEEAYSFTHTKYDPDDQAKTPYITQGGCFDGTYYYQAFVSNDETYGMIARYNVKTGELKYSEVYEGLGRWNDMTLNTKTGELLVAHNGGIHIFNPDTLEFEETRYFSNLSAERLSYEPTREKIVTEPYYSIWNWGLTKKESSFELNDEIEPVERQEYIHESIATDENFIYSLISDWPTEDGYYWTRVVVYDWSGRYITRITVDIFDQPEPENISVVDGEIYITLWGSIPKVPLVKVNID